MSKPFYNLNNNEESYSEPRSDYILTSIKNSKDYLKCLGLYEKLKNIISKSAGGFFLHLNNNKTIDLPIEICFFVNNFSQNVVNVVVLGEHSKANLYINCLGKSFGKHKSVNIFIASKGSSLSLIENHSWSPQNLVISKSYIILKSFARYSEKYINTKGFGRVVKKTKYIVEEKAKLDSKSELLVNYGKIITKSYAKLVGRSSIANLESKAVVYDGEIHTDLIIEASGDNSKGYARCDGIVVGNGYIRSNPGILVKNKTAKVLHEASVGSIPEDVIEYFKMRGLSEQEAINLFINSFLSI